MMHISTGLILLALAQTVTDERSTALNDARAGTLLARARVARLAQDSALQSYDATAYKRWTIRMRLSRIGRDRIAVGHESAGRVRWQRGVGIWVDVQGSRNEMPITRGLESEKDRREREQAVERPPIPWFPGQEALWIGSDRALERLVHPLADGAEAYYQYESGDSMSLRLPDGHTIQIRELRIRPRAPKWNLAVGSLWFDVASGQLVRAVYRLAEPMDMWEVAREMGEEDLDEDIPAAVKPLLAPMRGQVSAIVIEYGLYEGRFWLPRLRVAEGNAHAALMRMTFRYEQRFRYESVNADLRLEPIVVARGDSAAPGLGAPTACSVNPDSVRVQYENGSESQPPVAVRIPCNVETLRTSPQLPPSLFAEGEELAGGEEEIALIERALGLGSQAGWHPRRPTVRYVLELTRYNRVEGLSTGIALDAALGEGYSAGLIARIGVADLEPNVEMSVARTNLRHTLQVGAYNRLASANDWGAPLSFGASLSAFLFGRDEGFYFRQSGLELRSRHEEGAQREWRLFVEQQRSAPAGTTFSLAHALRGIDFAPNIEALRGEWAGAGVRLYPQYGADLLGFRFFGDVRLEGATEIGGTARFVRAAFDGTISRALGPAAAALTLAGGSSVGTLPAQRQWYLGGVHTVRGLAPGTAVGDAFWMTRAELGTAWVGWRPVLFYDAGWAGNRREWQQIGRPLQGAGVGISFLDGMISFDVARGIAPTQSWRADLSLESRF